MITLTHNGTRTPQSPALLPCQGHPSCGDWVEHQFVEVRFVPPMTKEDTASKEELYGCAVCGSLVRWGLLQSGEKRVVAPPAVEAPSGKNGASKKEVK